MTAQRGKGEFHRLSLFNKKFINKQIAVTPTPDVARVAAFKGWSDSIKSKRVASLKETELHGPFMELMIKALGYTGPVGSDTYSITQEKAIVQGSVDLALGQFSDGERKIIAPFELKGADTKNLDAIMSGRAKTPVDQAWEYATNNVGTKWVLVSNYLEIRLYSYGEGRQVYETFDLSQLHEPAEFARVQLLLSAENLLSGRTLELLEESRRENKDITNRLYADYKVLRSDLIGEVRRERPDLDPLIAIRVGQKILDRILFVAFAEDKGLLPRNTLEKAYVHSDPYNPRPVWETFQRLFVAIDQGSPPLNVPRYNGGLFAPDEAINALAMPDHICEGFKRLADYDFESEVSVTVLGHIFEQSIADVEQLQAEARGETVEAKKTTGTSGRRKRDGVVYTPDYIARFIVEQTLGTHCREIFGALLIEHAKKGASADDDPIAWKNEKTSEKTFWRAYRDRISKLRIVDPACGSGVFLVMAFDWLKAELTRINMRLEALGEGALFEVDSEILTHNLFGVDVNEESVEIAKLSLWIKTARHGKVLDSLDDNFRVGDSLIEDSSYAYRSHGFVWKEAFKAIFDEGGFDIVLGNPPYVRQELLKDLKPWLQGRFEVYHGVADLYAYFFERGLRILKPGGRMGYISSSTFFKTGSGAPLRDYLRNKATLETVVDFGDHQIFEGVTTYPAILTFRNEGPPKGHDISFWKIAELPKDNFDLAYAALAQPYPQSALGGGSWELENPALRNLRNKIVAGKPTLKAVYGSPLYGIKTGRNEAFVIDRKTRDALIAEDPKSTEILKPWADGSSVQKWREESSDLFVVLFPKGWTDEFLHPNDEHDAELKLAACFPAIWKHLSKHRDTARNRSDKGAYWWELRACAYYDKLAGPKILYRDISSGPTFSMERSGKINDTTSYFIPSDSAFLAGLLNSNVLWFTLLSQTTVARGGYYRFKAQYIEPLPIPPATDAQKAELAALAEAAQTAAEARYALQQEITRRIPDLATGASTGSAPAGVKLTERLKAWWDLPDFAAFQAEVKKALKSDIPLKDRNDWENWISENRSKIHALSAEIARIEGEIDANVYALFDLTPEEIALLEANI